MNMKKNLAWNTLGSIFYSGCQWLITIIVVYVATYETAGFLSLAMTMSSSFSAIALFSMRNYQVSDVKGEFHTGQYVCSRIWTCGIAFVVCAIFAAVGNSTFQMLCIDAFMLIRVAEALVDVMHGVDQKFDRYDWIGISYILRGIVTVLTFSIGLKLTDHLLVTLFLMAVFNLLAAVVFDCRKTGKLEEIPIHLADKEIMKLLKTCLPLVVFTFLLSLENYIPKKVLEYFFGAEQLGIYSTIASPTLVVQIFASVVFSPFLPQFSRIYYHGEIYKFRKLLHKVYFFMIGLCVVVTLGAVLLGKPGLRILFGADILVYYNLFMPIVYCTLFTGIVWILSAVVILLRRIKALVIAIIADFLLCIGIVVPIVQIFGQNGVSIVQLITLPILTAMMIGICEVTSYQAKRRVV